MEEDSDQSDVIKSEQTNKEDRQHSIRSNIVPQEEDLESQGTFHLWGRIVKHRCIFFVLLAALLSSMHSLMFRYVKEDIHAMQGAWVRSIFQLSIPVLVMTYRNISPKPESKTAFILLVVRGVFGAFAITCMFYSFNYMRVGDATAIVFGSPVFVGIFAKIIMKEPFGMIEIILVFTAIAGVFLISQPPFLFGSEEVQTNNTKRTYQVQSVGAIFAFCACVCISFTAVLMRKMGTIGVNSFKIVLYYASIASIVTSLLTTGIGVWTIPSCGSVRFALVAMGSFNCVAQCLVTYSLSVERTVFVSILRANEVIFAFILEYLLFHDYPGYLSLIGVFLVMSASVFASLRKMWMSKKQDTVVRENQESPITNS